MSCEKWFCSVLLPVVVVLCFGAATLAVPEDRWKETEERNQPAEAVAAATEDDQQPHSSHHILFVTLCLRGHFNPSAAMFRAMVKRGHRVTVFTTDSCPDMVQQLMPGAFEVHERVVVPDVQVPSDMFKAVELMDDYFREKGIINLYKELSEFLEQSTTKYDLVFGDFMMAGTGPAARRHSIPYVAQYMGPVIPTRAKQPPLLERGEVPLQHPGEKPGVGAIVASAVFSGLYEASVSYHCYAALQKIHADNGWERVNYGYGRFPFNYIHSHSILMSNGAAPFTMKPGERFENVHSIGFVPDELTYPPMIAELSDWLEKANGAVIFISLGTLTVIGKEETETLFHQLTSQKQFYFIWAVKTTMMEHLDIKTTPYIEERLFLGKYLPQGRTLQHPKVKAFVTHCGANSVQDAIYAAKPMLTYPGFADQPLTSNLLINLGVAKLLTKFDYLNMAASLEGLLAEPNYSQMVGRLEQINGQQMQLGGWGTAGVQLLERVIGGQVTLNTSVAAEDVFGWPLYDVIAICSLLLSAALSILLAAICCFLKLLCCFCAKGGAKRQPKNKLKSAKSD